MNLKLKNLYEVDEAYWDKSGVRISTHVDWKMMAAILDLEEEGVIIDQQNIPECIVDQAFQYSADRAQELAKENIVLTEIEQLEFENLILSDLIEHWKVDNVLPAVLKMNRLIDDANDWCNTGCNKPELFGVKPVPGLGIIALPDTGGFTLTIYKPFLIVYFECYYEANAKLPENNLEDLTGEDIFDILLMVQDYKHGDLHEVIDLAEWKSCSPLRK